MKWSVPIFLLLSLCGCAANVNPNSYSVGSVGQVNRTVSAIVISVRDIDIAGTSGLGATTGVALGATAGSGMGNSGRSNVAGAIGGALVGGIVGGAMEQGMTQQKGVEYVVETQNGNLMTLVQGAEPRFHEGERVLVLYGSPARIIVDPRRAVAERNAAVSSSPAQ